MRSGDRIASLLSLRIPLDLDHPFFGYPCFDSKRVFKSIFLIVFFIHSHVSDRTTYLVG